MTERFHFYERIPCKGASRVVFYGLPQHPEYYSDVLNWLSLKTQSEAIALFCALDSFALERIVGTQRMCRMLKAKNPVQVFM